MLQQKSATAAGSVATAAPSDTILSSSTHAAGLGMPCSPKAHRQAQSTLAAAADSSMQHLLSMLQTAEAADLISRQRDALAHPQQQQQLQSLETEQLQQQLQELSSLLLLPGMPQDSTGTADAAAAAAAAATTVTAGSTAALLKQQQDQEREGSPVATPPPGRQLQHMPSLADSSLQEATAADALLDLEFAARDAGSFTKTKGPLAALLARVNNAGEEAGPEAAAREATPLAADAGVDAGAATGAAAKGDSTATSGQPDSVAGAAEPDTAAAAAAGDSVGAAVSNIKLQHEQLMALLTQHLALPQAGTTTARPHSRVAAAEAPGARVTAAAGSGAATGASEGAAAGLMGSQGGAAVQDAAANKLPLLDRLRQQLALRQQQSTAATPAAAAAAAAAAPTARSDSTIAMLQMLRQQLQQQARQLPTLSGSSSGALERQQQADGGPGLLPRSLSNLTNSTVVTGYGPTAAAAAAAAAAPALSVPLAQRVQGHVSEGPYSRHLDAELLTLYAEFKSCRRAVLAIVKEAVDQGVMTGSVVRRLQQLRQQRGDSPSSTLGAATATASAGAAHTVSTAPSQQAAARQAKRSHTQTAADGDDAADADAPSSKLRRTDAGKAAPAVSVGAAAAAAEAGESDAVGGTSAQPDGSGLSAAEVQEGSGSQEQGAVLAEASEGLVEHRQQQPLQQGQTCVTGLAAAARDAAGSEPAAAPVPGQPAGAGAAAGTESAGLLCRSVEALVMTHSLANRVLAKAASARREACEAITRAEQFSAITAASHSNTQQLQLQNQMLQQQLQLASLQLQNKQQQLVALQARTSHSSAAYPQLVSRVARCVNRLVATAYHDHLPVPERQELAMVAEELLSACGQH